MQRICSVCGRMIDRNQAHYQDDKALSFYCLPCGDRRQMERGRDSDGFGLTVAMFVAFVMLLVVVAAVAGV